MPQPCPPHPPPLTVTTAGHWPCWQSSPTAGLWCDRWSRHSRQSMCQWREWTQNLHTQLGQNCRSSRRWWGTRSHMAALCLPWCTCGHPAGPVCKETTTVLNMALSSMPALTSKPHYKSAVFTVKYKSIIKKSCRWICFCLLGGGNVLLLPFYLFVGGVVVVDPIRLTPAVDRLGLTSLGQFYPHLPHSCPGPFSINFTSLQLHHWLLLWSNVSGDGWLGKDWS